MKHKKSITEQELSLNNPCLTAAEANQREQEEQFPPTKLVVKDNLKSTKFDELKPGDWFRYDNEIYIKTINEGHCSTLSGVIRTPSLSALVVKIRKVNIYIN